VSHHGVTFSKPKIDINQIRGWKESVIGKLTGGLAGLAKQRKVQVCRAWPSSAHPTASSWKPKGQQTVTFDTPSLPPAPAWRASPASLMTTRASSTPPCVALADVAKRMLVIGAASSAWKWLPYTMHWARRSAWSS